MMVEYTSYYRCGAESVMIVTFEGGRVSKGYPKIWKIVRSVYGHGHVHHDTIVIEDPFTAAHLRQNLYRYIFNEVKKRVVR